MLNLQTHIRYSKTESCCKHVEIKLTKPGKQLLVLLVTKMSTMYCCIPIKKVIVIFIHSNCQGRSQEKFVDTKWVIRNRKSEKDRQHNGQEKKDKRTNNDLQNNTKKSKDRPKRTPLKPGMNSKGNQFLLHM
jgi:hypothetical protein